MKRSHLFRCILTMCVLLALGEGWAQLYQFSGRVYEGEKGVETTPISGVTVTLYGSNNSSSLGSVITSTTTDAAGWYGLTAIRTSYEYYYIVETDPSGYTSTGAKSVSGTVQSKNQIQFVSVEGKTLTGNKFYDQKNEASASNNPPIAEAGGPYSCKAGGSITFDGSGSYDPDTGDKITKYEWDLDNDGQYDDATGKTTTKTYNSAGTETVGLRVTDSHGAQDTDTATYKVSEEEELYGTILGMKFNDLNGNHQKDPGEPGLAGWTIAYSGTTSSGNLIFDVTTTNSDGKYSFTDVPPGNYTLSENAQSGWTQTYPKGGPYNIQAVDITLSWVLTDIDFGNTESSSPTPPPDIDYGDAPSPYPEASEGLGGPWIGGSSSDAPDAESGMQRDLHARGDDQNGIDDESTIKLLSDITTGGMINTIIRLSVPPSRQGDASYVASFGMWVDFNQDGDWDDADENIIWFPVYGSFPMPMVSYIGPAVPATAKTGMTYMRLRITDGFWSNLSPNGAGQAGEVEDYEIEIKSGGTPLPPGGIIPGAKFNDQNGNGKWDAGEPGLSNWMIWLDMNSDAIPDPGEPTTMTDSNGLFAFTGLPDGNYFVNESFPPGWIQTCPGGMTSAFPYGVTLKNGKFDDPSVSVLFGNHQPRTPGSGTGAVKWFQPPLFHPEKFDEQRYYGWGEPSIDGAASIADDWFCYNQRPVTSITWWGTYANWDTLVPPPDAPEMFHIGIWTSRPKSGEQEWGSPDKMLCDWFVNRSQLGEEVDRSHYMPEWTESQPDTCFRYMFSIPAVEWFNQEGDSAEYWLSIGAVYTEPPQEHVWGWLTRELYFSANAVRIFAPASGRPDSLFRLGEPIQPEYWDMAFVLGTDQNTAMYDFGDAHDGYGTSLSHNAALHLIRPDIYLGATVDTEDDGQPDPAALGDDNNGSADEEGVIFLEGLDPGNMAKIMVSVSAHGFLSAWLDVDCNGRWDMRDRVLSNVELESGNYVIEFPVADDAVPGPSTMRFRFSTLQDVWVKGFAPDGEIEDYRIDIQEPSSTGADGGKVSAQPGEFKLYPNYPNPFNLNTTIPFHLPGAAHVRLSVYNLLGQEIRILLDEKCPEGANEVHWDGRDARHVPVPSGVYLYRLEAASFCGTGKLLLLK